MVEFGQYVSFVLDFKIPFARVGPILKARVKAGGCGKTKGFGENKSSRITKPQKTVSEF